MQKFKKIWQLLPIRFRNLIHFFIHRVNSSSVLLTLLLLRHKITVGNFKRALPSPWLRLGESRTFNGWVSTNYQVFTRHFLNATRFYGEEIFEYIYADNVIEHLELKQGRLLIENAYLALKPGGVLRLTTPDLGQVVDRYQLGNQEDLIQFADDMLGHGVSVTHFPDLLRVTFTAFGHHKGYIYDESTLANLLIECGFQDIVKYRPGDSAILVFQNLESRNGKSDMWSQMAIEAKKPQ